MNYRGFPRGNIPQVVPYGGRIVNTVRMTLGPISMVMAEAKVRLTISTKKMEISEAVSIDTQEEDSIRTMKEGLVTNISMT